MFAFESNKNQNGRYVAKQTTLVIPQLFLDSLSFFFFFALLANALKITKYQNFFWVLLGLYHRFDNIITKSKYY